MKKEKSTFKVDFSDLKSLLEEILKKKSREEIPTYSLLIIREDNGYSLKGFSDESGLPMTFVIEDDPQDELKSGESLLWEVMNYFSFNGSKHDPVRLRIEREKQR